MEWNDTKRDYPRDKCVHELFEAQVERTPDAVAVVFKDEQLTYQELNRRANQLAHYLRKLGVGSEVLVGICMERSLEMVVGLLGILKAGGAYVPLDPTYPKERLDFMLQDTQAPVLLTQQRLVESLPKLSAKILCLDTDWEVITQQRETNLLTQGTADNLAYVIYTSGSTGQPKGVEIPHRGVVRLVCGAEYVQFDASEVFLQLAPTSFDASTFEFWGALAHGACCVLFPGTIPTPQELGAVLRHHQVSTLWLTASLFNTVINAAPAVLSSVRQLLIGGEALSVAHVRQALALLPDTQIINGYGPTESTTFTCCYSIPRHLGQALLSIPIGRPIANTEVYILDPHLHPVPVGVVGELHISGDGLARGYLNRPELTAEKFIANPFSDDPKGRLYKTGDLARYLPDGNIEFIGRIDHQVKIRGFRIELGEIESTLAQYPNVQQVIVLAREDSPGNKRLVAYVVPHQHAATTVRELRSYLKTKLPEYMVPSVFVLLDRLPLTPNGKIDRTALPTPEEKPPELEKDYVRPTTPLEETLAGIWSKILGIRQVGIHDNFLELGGHSLLATQVVCRVADTFGVELSLRNLFDTPTVTGLAKIIEVQRVGGGDFRVTTMKPVARDQELPLSSSQKRVWFIQQLDAQNTSYNFQAILRFVGQLNVAALERSLSEIVRRHEIYRTTFPVKNGRPAQVIHDAEPTKLTVVTLQPLPEGEREAEAQRLINKELQKPFNLTQLPLIRWTLLRLTEKEHLLVHVEHHLLHDGWSFNVFVRELMELYKAFSTDNPSPLPEMPIQFVDFARWEQDWLQGGAAKTQLAYWKNKLTGGCFMLELPSDRPRPAVQSFRGAAPTIELPLNLCTDLRALSRREGVTLFMTMLTAFVTLLYRYTGQVNLCVGSGVANRRWRETEELIGMIINNIVLRNDLSDNPTVRQLLARVRDTTLEAYAHQDIPFDKVVETLQPKRDLSHNPLFQVAFGFHDAPMSEVEIPGLNVDLLVGLSNGSAKFDLNAIIIPHSNQHVGRRSREETDGLTLLWEYNTDLFDDSTMTRMIGHYQTLLEGIVANPDQRLSELPILTDAEERQLLVEWNDTKRDYPKDLCVHQLFEAQVERTPDAVAAVFEEQQLTYRELNRRANQLAHYLRKLGVGPEALVAICVERSLEMVVGLLGILKAGGAYVPLDPTYPKERLAFMIEDCRPPVLLTQASLLERIPLLQDLIENPKSKIQNPKVICLDTDWETIAAEDDGNPFSPVKADNLAYVIYTSGSTGKPKGVLIAHYNVTRLLQATHSWFHFDRNDVWTLFHSYAFDFSVWEMWGALLYGGRLVVVPYWVSRSPEMFYDLLRKEEVTVLNQTPSAFRQVIQVEPSSSNPQDLALRLVIFGGEALDFHSLRPWFDRHGDQYPQLVNMYGITETTVHVTYRPITAADLTAGRGSLIGVPIPDLALYVLDQNQNPVPIGVPGELCVGGAGVGRGYLNRPELTAERFILSPFRPGERLYRSGDLVRCLPNRDMEYLGRIDAQVKIRGFRIELGEIETVLSQHPAVRETVAIVREDEPGDKRLVAYLIAEEGQAPTINELRSFLIQKLPEHMIPSAFVTLDALPLTPNGKVDQRALPAPEQARPDLEETFVAPRTAMEDILAGIWSDVLGIQRVGIHDNFFDLGGHSLLAIRLISRVHDAFEVKVPLRRLFEEPTVAELVESIEMARRQEKEPRIPPIVSVSRDHLLPLSFSQQRLWFLDQLEPGSPFYNVPSAVRLTGKLNVPALEQSLNEIIRRHEVLRTTFTTVDGQPFQVIAPAQPLVLRVMDLRERPKTEREAEALRSANEEARKPFNLALGPLLRVTLLQLGPQDHVLIYVMHHIVCDAWSLGIFRQELWALYKAFSAGQPSPLPELPIQYADYAVWQRQWLQGEVLRAQLDYWKKQLQDLPTLQLSTDYPRPAVQTLRGARHSRMLSKSLSDAVKALSRQEGVTLFMSLLAAFQTLLHYYSAQYDIGVGTPVAGRNRAEIEQLIGFFVNTLIVRTDLSRNPSLREILRRVQEAALEAYCHQDLPFDKLVEELQPKRKLDHYPLFNVWFVVHNMTKPILPLSGLRYTIMNIESGITKYDLKLEVTEKQDGLRTLFVYNKDLFRANTIATMANHFERVLRTVTTKPETRLSEMCELLAQWDRQQVSAKGKEFYESSLLRLKSTKRRAIRKFQLNEGS